VNALLFDNSPNFEIIFSQFSDAWVKIFTAENDPTTMRDNNLCRDIFVDITKKVMHARVNVFIKAFREGHMSRMANKKSNGDLQLRILLKANKSKQSKNSKKSSTSLTSVDNGEVCEMFFIIVEITSFAYFKSAKLSSAISEQLILKEEPSNQFDMNAIAVFNSGMEQVGYVARTDSCKLATIFPFIAEAESIHSTITAKNGMCTVVLSTGECNRAEVTKILLSSEGNLPFYDISNEIDYGYSAAIKKIEEKKIEKKN
jgi:hypothetical protein